MNSRLPRFPAILVWISFVGAAGSVSAATLIYSPMDSLQDWTVRTLGPAQVQIISDQMQAACIELRSQGGTVLLSREIPRDSVAGRRVELSCLIKSENILRGLEATHTAKVHLALDTPQGLKHFSVRFTGSTPWREEGLVADVPRDVRRAVLNVGMEACTGRLCIARLSLCNDRRAAWPIPLAKVANAPRSQLGLAGLPKGVIRWHDIPFQLIDAAPDENDCIRLRGLGHDDWPAATAPIPLGRYATAVYLLHAAIEGRPSAESPCVLWTATLADGLDEGLSVFEGQQIGPLGSLQDLENWKVAWRLAADRGRPVTFGVTRWPLHLNAPVVTLSCRAYHGAPVVILAATAVEEPPAKSGAGSGDDESEQ